jgi:hypothetical protein
MEKLKGMLTQCISVPLFVSIVIQAKANNLFNELNASDADPKVSLSAPVLNDSHNVEDAWFPQAFANRRQLVICCFQA